MGNPARSQSTKATQIRIFRELTELSFDPIKQPPSQLKGHRNRFANKVTQLESTGFDFSRNQILGHLYQLTLGQSYYTEFNHYFESSEEESSSSESDDSEATSQHTNSTKEQSEPSSSTPATPQANEVNSRKRPNDDLPVVRSKSQKVVSFSERDASHDVIYELPLACRSLRREDEKNAVNLAYDDLSSFDTPFFKHFFRSEIASIQDYNKRVTDFLQWCSIRSIYLHPQLTLQLNRKNRQLSVKLVPSSEDQPTVIPKRTIVASIPTGHCFSIKTSSLGTDENLRKKFVVTNSFTSNSDAIANIISTYDASVFLALTMHLAHELSLGSQSPWFPYLNLISHPDHHTPVLMHLFVDRVPELLDWFKGTEIAKLMKYPDFYTLAFLKDHFHEHYPQDRITWECFLKAFTSVSSRAFEIDKFHQLGLVPLADLFDHNDEPDVQFVANFYVCKECGSSGACLHCYNRKDPNYHRFLEQQSQAKINEPALNQTVELRSIRALMPPQMHVNPASSSTPANEMADQLLPSVYNSYGELSNATLLTRYGFMISANTHDKIHFERSEVTKVCNQCVSKFKGTSPTTGKDKPTDWTGLIEEVLQTLGKVIESQEEEEGLIGALEPKGLWIDSNSKISPTLWLTVACETWKLMRQSTPRLDDLRDLYRLQHALHSLPTPNLLALPQTELTFSAISIILACVAEAVSLLASGRLSQYHLPELTIEELLNIKEELIKKETLTLTTMGEGKPALRIPIHQTIEPTSYLSILPAAIEYSVSERILVKKSFEIWSHILNSIRSLL